MAATALLAGCGNSVSTPLGPGATYGGATVQTYSVDGSPGIYVQTAAGTGFTSASNLITLTPGASLPSDAVQMCVGSDGNVTVFYTGDGWAGAEIICEIVPGVGDHVMGPPSIM